MTSSGDVVDGDLAFDEPDYGDYHSDDSNSQDHSLANDDFNNDEPDEEEARKLIH